MLTITDTLSEPSVVLHSEHDVARINSIKKLYPAFRQESKAPTFALTYQGTYVTLMANCGFSVEEAISIETKYHDLYSISDKWIADALEMASNTGYITAAFGLRLRTPLLKQVVLGTSKTPFAAIKEGRTAGNALGQSWGLLNTRSASEFLEKARNDAYALDIKPCAHIHDAQYFLVRDSMRVLLYVNEHLSKAVQWQEDPLIQNEHISMSGELSIFYPDWSQEMTIPNDADIAEVNKRIKAHLEEIAT